MTSEKSIKERGNFKKVSSKLIEEYKDLFTHYGKDVVEEVKETVRQFIDLTERLVREEYEEKFERYETEQLMPLERDREKFIEEQARADERSKINAWCGNHGKLIRYCEDCLADERRKCEEEFGELLKGKIEKFKLNRDMSIPSTFGKGDIIIESHTWENLKKEAK
jgi:hypothetical protein